MNIILTGMSGAGKTAALKALEDIGYLCMDNILPKMVPEIIFTNECAISRRDLAIITDLRGGEFFNEIYSVLDKLKLSGVEHRLVFFDADSSVLLNRFKEKRREHILSRGGLIEDGIAKERELLADIRKRSDLVVDTSAWSDKELKQYIAGLFGGGEEGKVHVVSFGFKRGLPQADFLFDVRFLPNPYDIEPLRKMNGLQKEVSDYVLSGRISKDFIERALALTVPIIDIYAETVCKTMIVAFGCTGGRHRSVACAKSFFNSLRESKINATISHRDIYVD